MRKLRFFSLILALGMIFSFAACGQTPDDPKGPDEPVLETLATPANVTIDDDGLISWDPVEHATDYVVKVGTQEYLVQTTSYRVSSITEDFTYSVKARAANYNDSAEATGSFTGKTLTISAATDLHSGQNTLLKAMLDGKQQQATWEITEGGQYASIATTTGLLTAGEVTENQKITVRAKSTKNSSLVATRSFTIYAQPELTQDMIEVLAGQTKLSFEGSLTVSCYNVGITHEFVDEFTYTLTTALDGANWYANYYDGNLSSYNSIYVKEHDGIASQVSLGFTNEEDYSPMLDDNDQPVPWAQAGYANAFTGLSVEDFTFDTDLWMWKYAGDDDTLMQRMATSANPYDFEPETLGLTIEAGEILGIRMISAMSGKIVYGYDAVQELDAIINYGDLVEVPTISKYAHDDIHNELNAAIANMRALTNYTVHYRAITSSYGSGYTISGFKETITPDLCYFRPFDSVAGQTDYIDTYTGEDYGYKKISDGLYNSFFKEGTGYIARRAFTGDFSAAKPTFAFAGEIFTQYNMETDGSTTFYVDEVMSTVATTFYQGIGTDMQLYGMFATRGYTSSTTSFTPYVTVKDGYITEAGFYFYLGNMYGVIELEYGDFGTATLPAEAGDVSFDVRQLPSSWSQLTVIQNGEGAEGDVELNAADYLKTFFGVDDIDSALPFFGSVLGDTYGFGLSTYQSPGGTGNLKPCVMLYYDVLLDEDYTIESSMKKAKNLLKENGFEENKYGEFVKGNVKAAIVDNNLDFTIYLWKAE